MLQPFLHFYTHIFIACISYSVHTVKFQVQGNSQQPISILLRSKSESTNNAHVLEAYSKLQHYFPAVAQSRNAVFYTLTRVMKPASFPVVQKKTGEVYDWEEVSMSIGL